MRGNFTWHCKSEISHRFSISRRRTNLSNSFFESKVIQRYVFFVFQYFDLDCISIGLMIVFVKEYCRAFLRFRFWLLDLYEEDRTRHDAQFSKRVRYFRQAFWIVDIVILRECEGSTEVWWVFHWWMHFWQELFLESFPSWDISHSTDRLFPIVHGKHRLPIIHFWAFLSFSFRSEQEAFFWVAFLTFWEVFAWEVWIFSWQCLSTRLAHFLQLCEWFLMVSVSFPSVSLQIDQNPFSSFSLAWWQFSRMRVMLSSFLQLHSQADFIWSVLMMSFLLEKILLEKVVPYEKIIVNYCFFEKEFQQVFSQTLRELFLLLILRVQCGFFLLVPWEWLCVIPDGHRDEYCA